MKYNLYWNEDGKGHAVYDMTLLWALRFAEATLLAGGEITSIINVKDDSRIKESLFAIYLWLS